MTTGNDDDTENGEDRTTERLRNLLKSESDIAKARQRNVKDQKAVLEELRKSEESYRKEVEQKLKILQAELAAGDEKLNRDIASKQEALKRAEAAGVEADQIARKREELAKLMLLEARRRGDKEEEIKLLQELAGQFGAAEAAGKELANAVFGIDNKLLKLLHAMDLSKEGIGDLWKGFKKAAFEGKNWKKVIGAGFLKISELAASAVMYLGKTILQLAFAQDEAMSGFMKMSGASYGFAAQIPSINADLHAVGISAQDAGKAFGGLYNSFADFTEIGGSARASISRTVALLQEIGVSADTSGKILDTAMRSLGLHAKAAEKMLLEVASVAKATRQPFTKVAQDFASVSPKLTKYGDQMMKVFEGLEKQSKRTGLAMGKLISVTEQFDTFEGAGRAVGRLNAILGGPYLNAIDMLNATDEERIDILQRLTEQSGLQFDELNRYEQMNIAKAMGTDVDTARRMFGQSSAEFEKQSMAQERLATMARESQTLIDQLKFAFQSALVGMRPIIEKFIVPFIHGLGSANQEGGTFIQKLKDIGNAVTKAMSWIGTLMLIGGILLTLTGGGATVGVPMAIAGAKLAGIGFGARWVAGKMAEVATEGTGATVAAGRARESQFKADLNLADTPGIPGFQPGGVVRRTAASVASFASPLSGAGLLARLMKKRRSGTGVPPASPIRMNEGGAGETAIVPYGTYIANANETKRVTDMTTALLKEFRSLRQQLSTYGEMKEITFMMNDNEFGRVLIDGLKLPAVDVAMRGSNW